MIRRSARAAAAAPNRPFLPLVFRAKTRGPGRALSLKSTVPVTLEATIIDLTEQMERGCAAAGADCDRLRRAWREDVRRACDRAIEAEQRTWRVHMVRAAGEAIAFERQIREHAERIDIDEPRPSLGAKPAKTRQAA